MIREESQREGDSGWSFMAGNEDDEFLENYKNIEFLSIASISYQIKVRGECIMDNKIRIMSEKFENTTKYISKFLLDDGRRGRNRQ